MSKLPKIFHNNDYISTNNKLSFYSTKEEFEEKNEKIDIYKYLNRVVEIVLQNNDSINGKIVSIRDNSILLNNGISIDINNISYIK